MATTTISIIPPRVFDFSDLDNGTSIAIDLKRQIDVSGWLFAALLVRVTSLPVTSGTPMADGTIVIKAQYDGYTQEDPAVLFASDGPWAPVTINSATSVPSLLTINLGGTLGRMLKIVAVGTRTSPTTNNISAMFSVDLKLRNGWEV